MKRLLAFEKELLLANLARLVFTDEQKTKISLSGAREDIMIDTWSSPQEQVCGRKLA